MHSTFARRSCEWILLFPFLITFYARVSGGVSLYKEGDNILELDVDTFNSTVYNKPHAHFVEFYSSWCGHCIDYAPHYVKFATLLNTWKEVVIVSALNCAEEKNAPACREHEIDAFPTLRYFKVWSKNKHDSLKFEGDKKKMDEMSSKIAAWVKEDYDREKPLNWPRYELANPRFTLSDLWAAAPTQATYLCLVVEDVPTNYGFSLLSNYAGDARVSISILLPSNSIAARFDIAQSPSLMIFQRSDKEHLLHSLKGALIWAEMKEAMDGLLKQTAQMSNVVHLDNNNLAANEKTNDQLKDPAVATWNQFEVQYLDLISAMHYMLTQEVPRKSAIREEHFLALRDWVHVLKNYGPGATPVRRFFYRLDQFLSTRTEVSAEQWLSKVEELQGELGHPLPTGTSFMACKGSKPYLRGYTCGVWTLAHAITVEAYRQEGRNPAFDPLKQVLEPFHQFIVQFLSCEVCAKNFHDLTAGNKLSDVKKPEDVVLWLWRAHNNVNKRLTGEKSDDPLFPKQQFPSARLCPQCRLSDGESFSEQRVLEFLLKYYSNIKIDGLKLSPGYQMKEFADGKLVMVANRHLNPKFAPMAGKIDDLEELEAMSGGAKRHWKNLNADDYGSGERTADRSTFFLIWMVIVGLLMLAAYMKYRRAKSKFWKTFYYYNDYRIFPWRYTSISSMEKYRV